jgi:beta-N-acetylhexosaminidase
VVIVSFGTPYLLDEFPEIGTAICTYGPGESQENSVLRVLKGESVPTGKLPVSLSLRQP